MRIHDTLTRQKEPLAPIDGEVFRFYCCGPTVYGPAHIGNFRTFVVQDTFRRVLELSRLKTKHVRNITDLDDKTIRNSIEAKVPLGEFTDGWRDKFHADCEALNLLEPHVEPSAVEHIPHQIALIETLIEKGHAYASEDGSVYFKISSYDDYGKLSHLKEREVRYGETISADEYDGKDAVGDFVLWKARKEEDGDNFWDSPWGEGRPGWHLECSAMAHEYLGEEFDLHSGGADLIFPHHDNEIAQSCCATGKAFSHRWFHSAHLMVDGGKMSKSAGTMYTLSDLVEKGHSPAELRYALLSGKYRQPLNFTFGSLDDARSALAKLAKAEAALLAKLPEGTAPPSYEELCAADVPASAEKAWASLTDDLNTPGALGALFTAMKSATAPDLGEDQARELHATLHLILHALGLVLPQADEPAGADVPPEILELAARRAEAKAAKDWATSDALRDEIKAAGYIVTDTPDGYDVTPA